MEDRIIKRILCICALLLSTLSQAQDLRALTYATEIYPPFSHYQDNQHTGFAVEYLELIWQELQMEPQQVLVLPWARAYYQLQHQDNFVLFTISRLKHREKLFQWACPIDRARYILFALKHKTYPAQLTDKIADYRIGTVRQDAAEQLLLSTFGSRLNLVSNVSMQANLEMMAKDRIDFIAYDERSLVGLEQYGYQSQNYKKVMDINNADTCFAFNLNVPKALVQQFQTALSTVIQSQAYQQLRQKYQLGPLPQPLNSQSQKISR